MFTASRHARQLAGNFLDDVDEYQRASRAADRRAMSHYDVDDFIESSYCPSPRRRSMSVSRYATHHIPTTWRSASVEPTSYRYSQYPCAYPVTVVGSRYLTSSSCTSPSRSYTSPYYGYTSPYCGYTSPYCGYTSPYGGQKYYDSGYYGYPSSYYSSSSRYATSRLPNNYGYYTPRCDYSGAPYYYDSSCAYDPLPTSCLKASHAPVSTRWETLSKTLYPSRRYLTSSVNVVVPIPPVQHLRYSRPTRYGSVPPISMTTRRRPYRAGSVLNAPPRELHLAYYSDLTGNVPLSTKHVINNSHLPRERSYYRHIPNACYLSEVAAERRRIDRKMDNLLDYKLPPATYYDDLKSSLRSVRDKMDVHRSLLDRYAAINMADDNSTTAEERINAKCHELGERFACPSLS